MGANTLKIGIDMRERFLRRFVIVFMSVGVTYNVAFVMTLQSEARMLLIALQFSYAVIVLVFLGMVGSAVASRRFALSEWGFDFNRRLVLHGALLVVTLWWYADRLTYFHIDRVPWGPFQLLTILVEELLFRAAIINYVLLRMRPGPLRFALAITASTIAFLLVHVPTSSGFHLVQTIFPMGVVFASVYYFTRSILWMWTCHVIMNLGGQLGLWSVVLPIGIYLVLSLIGQAHERRHRGSQMARVPTSHD